MQDSFLAIAACIFALTSFEFLDSKDDVGIPPMVGNLHGDSHMQYRMHAYILAFHPRVAVGSWWT